jgi:two-component system copper resistance phosphate regulon response regulator CusR
MRILVAEDEPRVRAAICRGFREEGFAVIEAEDGQAALDRVGTEHPDLLVLDWMLPKASGLEVLRTLRRAKSQLPVLMLTVRDEVRDRAQALNEGADDYLLKPFAFEELLARARAILRRSQGQTASALSCADLLVDRAARSVLRSGTVIRLTEREYRLLVFLLEQRGAVVSRAAIESAVWGEELEGASNIVDVYIRYLRQKIDAPFSPKLIHTVRGVGYALREGAP